MRLVALCAAVAVVTTAAACGQPAMPSDPYRAEIVRFQQEREVVLRADDGWLTIRSGAHA